MSIALSFKLVSGRSKAVLDYLNNSESGAIEVAEKPPAILEANPGYVVYHFKASTVKILAPDFDDHRTIYTIYSDFEIGAAHAKSRLEEAADIKLEEIK
jgi:hypothetical protein